MGLPYRATTSPEVALLTPLSAAETEAISAASLGSFFDQLTEVGKIPQEPSGVRQCN